MTEKINFLVSSCDGRCWASFDRSFLVFINLQLQFSTL